MTWIAGSPRSVPSSCGSPMPPSTRPMSKLYICAVQGCPVSPDRRLLDSRSDDHFARGGVLRTSCPAGDPDIAMRGAHPRSLARHNLPRGPPSETDPPRSPPWTRSGQTPDTTDDLVQATGRSEDQQFLESEIGPTTGSTEPPNHTAVSDLGASVRAVLVHCWATLKSLLLPLERGPSRPEEVTG